MRKGMEVPKPKEPPRILKSIGTPLARALKRAGYAVGPNGGSVATKAGE